MKNSRSPSCVVRSYGALIHWFVLVSAALLVLTLTGGLAVAQDQPAVDGRALYNQNCAICHGANGDGQGALAVQFSPRPRNFTIGSFRFRSTDYAQPPAADDIQRIIMSGIEGSYGRSMPAFGELTPDEVQALAQVVLDFAGYEDFGVPIDIPPRPEIRRPQQGRLLYSQNGCADCHGIGGGGDGINSTSLVDEDNQPILPANLHSGLFKGGSSPENIYMRIQLGIDGTPMPSFGRSLSVDETWALVDFIIDLGQAE